MVQMASGCMEGGLDTTFGGGKGGVGLMLAQKIKTGSSIEGGKKRGKFLHFWGKEGFKVPYGQVWQKMD